MIKNLKLICILALISLSYACINNNKDKTINDSTESISATEQEMIKKPAIISDIPWSAVLDSATQKFTLKQNSIVKREELDSTNVLEAINRKYPENRLVWDHQSGDTAFVKIPKATYLTQQNGTTGAQVFLAESTYSITEIPGIRVVYFDFKIGDHASPGLYHREDFNFSMPQ